MLAEYFGTIGLLKRDKRTGTPKVWLYRDKETDEPKGDATVTYEDPHAALAAVEWFNNKDFHGSTIGVFMAESKNKGGGDHHLSESFGFDGDKETNGGGAGRGRGQGDSSAKPWPQDGDWMCPNTRDLSGNSFSGPIPLTLGDLEHLLILNLSRNYLNGPLPAEFENHRSIHIISCQVLSLSAQSVFVYDKTFSLPYFFSFFLSDVSKTSLSGLLLIDFGYVFFLRLNFILE